MNLIFPCTEKKDKLKSRNVNVPKNYFEPSLCLESQLASSLKINFSPFISLPNSTDCHVVNSWCITAVVILATLSHSQSESRISNTWSLSTNQKAGFNYPRKVASYQGVHHVRHHEKSPNIPLHVIAHQMSRFNQFYSDVIPYFTSGTCVTS